MKTLVRLFCAIVMSAGLAAAVQAAEGKVVSFLDTENYTYVEVSQNDQISWIVGPLVKVQIGDQVTFAEGAIMGDFYSKQLDRTFPEVMFVQGIEVVQKKK